jgi:dihydrofolate synthase/folylpolyglutamate synthase
MSDSARGRSRRKPEISTYAAAKRYLGERVDFERMRVVRFDKADLKLERMHVLLRGLGNPHELVRMVHVAGTVGKGSTVAMISSMLQGCGYAVGQFTSPHLVNVRERIAINGEMIGRAEFTSRRRRRSTRRTSS